MDGSSLLLVGLFMVAGFLGVIGEARATRRRMADRLQAIEGVLAEIRDRLPRPPAEGREPIEGGVAK